MGYEKHPPRKGKNARNGYTSKTMICDEGEIDIETPRDRDGTFEPQLIRKNQTRITGMDEQIIALYAKGLSNQEIVEMFKQLYDADVSTSPISRVTDAVKERVLEWQNRGLQDILIACSDGLKGFPTQSMPFILKRKSSSVSYIWCEIA